MREAAAFYKARERCKGIEELVGQMGGESAIRIGKRATTRIAGDAHGKGIVRRQAKCADLRAFLREGDAAAAESMKTTMTSALYGREYVGMAERLTEGAAGGKMAQFAEVDMRGRRRRKSPSGTLPCCEAAV